jgi:hypothetical protein
LGDWRLRLLLNSVRNCFLMLMPPVLLLLLLLLSRSLFVRTGAWATKCHFEDRMGNR